MKNFVAVAVLLISLTGCGSGSPSTTSVPTTGVPASDPNAARNASIIRLATSQAVALGLSEYSSQGNGTEAVAIATKMQQIITGSALPYINGSAGASTAAINGFINGQFITLPAQAQSVISLASVLLDSYLPAPAADTYLSADQTLYVKAFLNGLNDGAAQFEGNPPPAPATPAKKKSESNPSKALWFNPAAKK